MVFFKPTPQEIEVEKATSELNVQDDWGLIMAVCDKAGKTTEEAKNYLKAIIKRLNNANPRISLQAVTLLDACVKNSGKTFHLEIASGEFEVEYTKLLSKCHPKVVQKLKESLKKWAEGEFKNDTQLNLIPSLYNKLKNKGVDFSTEPQMKKTVTLSKDPNVVNSQDEEDQIAKAIELSLKENMGSPRAAASSSLYPSTNLGATSLSMSANTTPQKDPRKVRALYDFEAAEDNELTFSSGEIIFVIDDSDANWWKGSNQRGEGLFPASFVTADLSVEPEQIETKKKSVETEDKSAKETGDVEVNEEKIDRLLHLLHEADPTNSENDTNEMLQLEREVNAMGPLIDSELERVDRKHAQLAQLSADLVEALSLYHQLMREPQQPMNKMQFPYGQPSHSSQPMSYNGVYPMSMGAPSMGPYPSMQVPDRPYMPPPPHFPPQGMPPQSLPPGMMGQLPHPSMQMPPVSGPPPTSLPHGMPPPSLQHPPPAIDDRIQPNPNMTHLPQGMPSYGPTSVPPGFQPNGPQIPVQNGPGPQPGHFPPTPNTHIM